MNDIDILKKAIAKKHPVDPAHKALERVVQAIHDAIWAADYLSEQQAIPDYGYKERLEKARRVLQCS